uniref:Uncharacterized protein n=1 Tax=Anopheles funestus TaxID=62324 RepID=A0A182S101_ANOFN
MKHLNTVFLFVIFALLGLVVAQPDYGINPPPIVPDDRIFCRYPYRIKELCPPLREDY